MTMLAPEDYLTEVLHGLEPPPPVEVPLSQAHGLVLAEDVAAAVAVPPWTNSAMDGYALRAQDAAGAGPSHPVRLPVAGDVPAGSAPQPLAAGTAQRIMTGAMLPPGADTVVRVEDTDQEPGPAPLPQEVEIRRAIHRGQHVRRSGEDLGAGAPVLGRGSILSARALAALASTGLGAVRAWPRVRVAVVSTGAELREPGQDLEPGTIPDSNGLLLAGLVAEHGAQCTAVLRSPDTAAELAALLVQAAEEADLVITSGGVSAGAFDPLTEIAAAGQDGKDGQQDPAPTGSGPARGYSPTAGAAGRIRLRRERVAMQPGKPQAHGRVHCGDGRQVPLLCLPGNPVSVLVSFTTIAAPVLARLGGYDSHRRTARTVAASPRAPRASAPSALCDPAMPPAPSSAAAAPAASSAPGRSSGAGGPAEPVLRPARAAESWATPPGRRQYLPVRVLAPAPAGPAPTDAAGGGAQAQSTPDCAVDPGGALVAPSHRLGSGSHLVASLPGADALAVVGAEVERVEAGDLLQILPLSAPPSPLGPPGRPAADH